MRVDGVVSGLASASHRPDLPRLHCRLRASSLDASPSPRGPPHLISSRSVPRASRDKDRRKDRCRTSTGLRLATLRAPHPTSLAPPRPPSQTTSSPRFPHRSLRFLARSALDLLCRQRFPVRAGATLRQTDPESSIHQSSNSSINIRGSSQTHPLYDGAPALAQVPRPSYT